jgi:cytidine deaminase
VSPTVLESVPLDAVPADLLSAARAAWRHAYAPYSGFSVGAALRDGEGRVHAGANVENASYGLGRCAEQSAVQAMASAGGRHLLEIVIVTVADPAASPCGACRQVLHEFGADATVYLVNERHAWRTSVARLLPDGFRLEPPTAP